MNGVVSLPILLALAAAEPAPAPDEEAGVYIKVPTSRMEECLAQGGCAFITRDEFMTMRKEMAAEAAQEVKNHVDSNGCLQGNT